MKNQESNKTTPAGWIAICIGSLIASISIVSIVIRWAGIHLASQISDAVAGYRALAHNIISFPTNAVSIQLSPLYIDLVAVSSVGAAFLASSIATHETSVKGGSRIGFWIARTLFGAIYSYSLIGLLFLFSLPVILSTSQEKQEAELFEQSRFVIARSLKLVVGTAILTTLFFVANIVLLKTAA